MHLAAVLLAMVVYFLSNSLKQYALPEEATHAPYMVWMRTLLSRMLDPSQRMKWIALTAATATGSLNQCIYAVVGPHVGLSYTQIGAQLAASLLIQAVVVPRVIQLVPRAWSQRSIAIAAAASLAAGCCLVPWLQGRKDCVVLFYVATTALIDVPAAALANVLGGEFVSSFPAGEQAYVRMFTAHTSQSST